MNATLRQHRALRRANTHTRTRRAPRAATPAARTRVPFAWVESWPAILAGLAVALTMLYARAWGAL